jgi:tRNA U55 pseudouridine synthase TruB
MYWWARQSRLNEISIPSKEVTVKSLDASGWRSLSLQDVAEEAIQRIKKVNGDFRQEEIIEQWQSVARRQSQVPVQVARCRIVCSSGTYVRGLAHSLGRALKVPTLAYSIRRTRIGHYTLD